MFGYNALVTALKNGDLTKISVEGKEYTLSQSENFRKESDGCSGILGNALSFQLKVTEIETGSKIALSFSAVNKKTVRVGEIKLFSWMERKNAPENKRCVYGFCDSLLDQFVCKAKDESENILQNRYVLFMILTGKKVFLQPS